MNRIRLSITLSLLVVFGCGRPHFETQRSVKKAIDTLYRNELAIFNSQHDSLCRIVQDSLYPIHFDSILAQREKEKQDLLDQLPFNQ